MESISGWSLLGRVDFTYFLPLSGFLLYSPVFEDKKISVTCLSPQGAPWPLTFGDCAILSGLFFSLLFEAAVAVSLQSLRKLYGDGHTPVPSLLVGTFQKYCTADIFHAVMLMESGKINCP